MAGTRLGGLKAAAKNKARDPDFYSKIGRKGGLGGNGGGFACYTPCDCNYLPYQHHKAQCAGARGGTISRRKAKS